MPNRREKEVVPIVREIRQRHHALAQNAAILIVGWQMVFTTHPPSDSVFYFLEDTRSAMCGHLIAMYRYPWFGRTTVSFKSNASADVTKQYQLGHSVLSELLSRDDWNTRNGKVELERDVNPPWIWYGNFGWQRFVTERIAENSQRLFEASDCFTHNVMKTLKAAQEEK